MSPQAQLKAFIAKFNPKIAALARAASVEMRQRYPNAFQLVYDNYNALAMGFGPTERTSDAVFSIAVYPQRVLLCFLQGGTSNLKDPEKLLQGSGKLNRFIPLKNAAILVEPAVSDLISQANSQARTPISSAVTGHLIIKSVSSKQRPRRPSAAGGSNA